MPSLAPPDEASTNTDAHANTEEKLYFDVPKVDCFDIKTYEKRTMETVPPWGTVSSCKVAPSITMMCLRGVARSRPACNSPLHYLPTPSGFCFGKDAIIGPRAPPRDDKLQSIECDTRHSAKFSYVRMPPECVHDAGYQHMGGS